jgi:hypothetical protein
MQWKRRTAADISDTRAKKRKSRRGYRSPAATSSEKEPTMAAFMPNQRGPKLYAIGKARVSTN